MCETAHPLYSSNFSCDALAVLADLEPVGELLRGEELHLFQQGKITVGVVVTGQARVSVPVPHATEIACLLDDSEIRHTGLSQVVSGEHAGPPSTEDDDIDLVADGRTRRPCHVRVAEVECLSLLECGVVLLLAIGTKPPIPLFSVLVSQRRDVHLVRGRHHGGIAGHVCSPSVSCGANRRGRLSIASRAAFGR